MSKRICLFCLSVVVSGLCAHAQLPAAPVAPVAPVAGAAASPAPVPVQHSLSMEVEAVGSGGTGKSTHFGTAQITTVHGHRTVLSIEVRNFSQHPDKAHVEWYFFAAELGSSKEYIFDSGNSDVPLQPGGAEKVSAASKELTTSEKRSIKTGVTNTGIQVPSSLTRSEGGNTVKGWLVRLMADGKVIQMMGSASKYEEMGRHDADLQALKAQGAPKASQ